MNHSKAVRVLLEPLARTATNSTPKQTDYTAGAVRLYLTVTAASGTGGLQPQIRGYDRFGNAVALTTGGTAITATGTFVYEMGISVAAAAGSVKEAVSRMLPLNWDVNVVAGDSSSYTYSLTAETLQA
jgi:hypothetical protein